MTPTPPRIAPVPIERTRNKPPDAATVEALVDYRGRRGHVFGNTVLQCVPPPIAASGLPQYSSWRLLTGW